MVHMLRLRGCGGFTPACQKHCSSRESSPSVTHYDRRRRRRSHLSPALPPSTFPEPLLPIRQHPTTCPYNMIKRLENYLLLIPSPACGGLCALKLHKTQVSVFVTAVDGRGGLRAFESGSIRVTSCTPTSGTRTTRSSPSLFRTRSRSRSRPRCGAACSSLAD
eukprot:1156551-Pleurochrysis_carterae.AAC.1